MYWWPRQAPVDWWGEPWPAVGPRSEVRWDRRVAGAALPHSPSLQAAQGAAVRFSGPADLTHASAVGSQLSWSVMAPLGSLVPRPYDPLFSSPESNSGLFTRQLAGLKGIVKPALLLFKASPKSGSDLTGEDIHSTSLRKELQNPTGVGN